MNKDEIIKSLEKMTIVELNELVKAIEDHFGVVAAAAVAAPVAADANEESSEVSVILNEVGQSRVAVIKLVGKLTGKGLMDAKKFIEKLPVVIKEKINPEEAEDIKDQLIEVGATAEVK